MQHGVALSEEQDPARPLAEEGRAAVESVVARARADGVEIDVCLHSGKLRAQQTAQVLADGLGIDDVRAHAGLSPSDDVAPVARWLADSGAASIAVVGHLPFLDRLASLLVAGDPGAQVLRFQNAGLVKLVPKADGEGYAVAWVLVPDLA
jgi:phosphohistidine phosphatase